MVWDKQRKKVGFKDEVEINLPIRRNGGEYEAQNNHRTRLKESSEQE